MCWTLYIATDIPQKTGHFVPEITKLYLDTPVQDEMERLIPLFTKPHLYKVGSDTSCGCGFEWRMPQDFELEYFDEADFDTLKKEKQSPAALLEFLRVNTVHQSIELFSKWEGWDTFFIKNKCVRDIRNISLEMNYFGMEDQQFILFKQQTI
jgi:glutaredoxin-related protein